MNAIEVREFLDEHPEVFERFEREALRVIERGFEHYSAYTLIEVLRHHSNLEADPTKTYKINSHIIPTLARDFMDAHSEAPPKFFELRRARTTRKNEPELPIHDFDAQDQGGLF